MRSELPTLNKAAVDNSTVLRWLGRAAFLALPLLCACAEDRKGEQAEMLYDSGDYTRAEQILKKPATNTDQNYVLNNDRLGSAALADYDLDTAEQAFLRSYEVINSTGVNDAGRALSAVVVSEDTKIWKGEPFERAMVNYYLGLLYYMQHDYNNSRAAFENALFKLRDYGDADKPDEYADINSDFVLAYLMLGKCYQHLNRPDRAADMFAKVSQIRPDLASLAQGMAQDHNNLLLVVDYGQGPEKRENVDHAFVGYGPTPDEAGPIPQPQVVVDGALPPTLAPAYPTLDLLALAQDRKWQDIDTIRAVKSVAGKALMGVGAYETAHGLGFTGHRENTADIAAGLGMIAVGALVDASSQADLRQWEELPRTVFVIPLQVPPGAHDVTVQFPTGQRQTWHALVAPSTGEATYYYRVGEANPPDRQWPPATYAGSPGSSGLTNGAGPANGPASTNAPLPPVPPGTPMAETR